VECDGQDDGRREIRQVFLRTAERYVEVKNFGSATRENRDGGLSQSKKL
jgi:hypothetical protein